MKLWIEHHTHLTDRMFERGLFRLPEFEGIEILLWDRCEGGSIATRRALTQWLMMRGKWRQALHVGPRPDQRDPNVWTLDDVKKWSMQDACDAAVMGEIYMGLEDYPTSFFVLLRAVEWWCNVPEETEMAGHFRDHAMTALKLGRSMKVLGSPDARKFFNMAYNMCWKYLQEFDMRDRIMIFEAVDEITPIVGLKKLIMQMHAVHGKQSHSWANRLVQDGHAHLERGDIGQARDCFHQAIEIDDQTLDIDDVERAAPWNGLGSTYITKPLAPDAEKREARRCFEKAAEIWERSEERGSPTHARILYNLALVVEPKHGVELLRKAIRYDPNCKEFKIALQLIEMRLLSK